LSAPGDFTPPEFPSGVSASQDLHDPGDPQDPQNPQRPEGTAGSNGGPPAVSPGVAAGILAAVLALGLVAVFTLGRTGSGGTALVAKPGATQTVPGFGRGTTPTAASSHGAGTSTAPESGVPTSSGGTRSGGSGADPSVTGSLGPEFYVGECVNTSGSGPGFTVSPAGCQGADYKIVYSFANESGDVDDDMSQCYSINGNDNEFENGDAADGYTLFCMNSLVGDYSPRRAEVDNCLDSAATYEVDCTSSKAAWIVVGRLDDTTDSKDCSQFSGYDTSYFWTSEPSFVLCVHKYSH
jgi:hypothetical protein